MKKRIWMPMACFLAIVLTMSGAHAEVLVGGKSISPSDGHRSIAENARDIFYDPYGNAQPATDSAQARQGYMTYQVQPGDTLTGIALTYLGNANQAYSLAAMNGITNPHQIHAGQTIYIPRPRVGLQYKIELLRTTANGCAISEVNDNYVFSSGDKFRLRLKSNTNGYLYVFNRGTSNNSHLVFPDPRMQDGRNFLKAFREYTVPAAGWFQFDNRPGTESLYVVQSLQPVNSFSNFTNPSTQINPGQIFAQPLNPQQWQVVANRIEDEPASGRDIFLAYDQPIADATNAQLPQSGYITQNLNGPNDIATVQIALNHR